MPIIHEQEGRSNGEKWNRAIGPFYSSTGVLRRMGVDQEALTEMVHTGRILGLSTIDGHMVFPTRQFFPSEGTAIMVNPVITRALQLLMKHEGDFADVRALRTKDDIPLVDGWTIAEALLQRDKEGNTLLDELQKNMDNTGHESWQRLLDLNGVVSGIRNISNQLEGEIDK